MDHEGASVDAGAVDGGGDGTVIDLHVTDAASAAGPGGPGGQAPAGGVAALSRAGVADGLPFLLSPATVGGHGWGVRRQAGWA